MGKIIAITNQKGGVGKTTTAINLSAYLGELKKKVLVIDMDPQANLTSGFGIEKERVEKSTYELLLGEVTTEEIICKEITENLDVLPGSTNLSAIEVEVAEDEEKEFIVKKIIETVKEQYDYIVIDCPPSLNILTINALTAADSVLVPIQCEYYALEGLSQLIHTVELIKERLNPKLEFEGIVFTMYDSRTNLSSQVVENVQKNLNHHIYKTMIPRNIRLAEAPSFGMPISEYAMMSAGAKCYKKLAKEIIRKGK